MGKNGRRGVQLVMDEREASDGWRKKRMTYGELFDSLQIGRFTQFIDQTDGLRSI